MYEATLTVMSVTGIYLLLGAFLMNTENATSAFLFKFIPFVLGAALIYLAVEMYRAPETVFGDTPGASAAIVGTPGQCISRRKLPTVDHPGTVCSLVRNDTTRRAPSNITSALLTPMSERYAGIPA